MSEPTPDAPQTQPEQSVQPDPAVGEWHPVPPVTSWRPPSEDAAAGKETAPRDRTLPWKLATLGLAALALVFGLLWGQQVMAPPEPAPTVTVTTTVTPGAEQAEPNPERDAFLLKLPRREEGDPRAKGPVDAPIVLTEWADYRCPYCSVFTEQILPELLPLAEQGKVRIEFRDMASFGEDSVRSAAAARAAGEQGLFWEYQQALFEKLPDEGHPPVGDDLIMEVAREVKVPDLETFQKRYQDKELHQAVLDETEEARQLGISSTPMFLIGTETIPGAQPADVFVRTIQHQTELHG